jgi:transcriptional regulator with XRE-family HTH domain
LKALREQKNMSQRDIEKRTGLLRCYISRVENGRIVPAIDTLERMAQALQLPMYALFYDGDKPSKQKFPATSVAMGSGSSGRDAQALLRFRRLISRTTDGDLKLLLYMAQKMSQRNKSGRRDVGQDSNE